MCRFWSIGHSYLKVVHGYNEQNLCNSWCCLETNFRISSENIKRSLSYQCGQATRQYCITGQHINTQRTLFTVNMIFKPKWKCIQTIIEKDTNSVDSCCLQVSSISFKFFIPSLFLLWERRNEKLFFFSNNCIRWHFKHSISKYNSYNYTQISQVYFVKFHNILMNKSCLHLLLSLI